jgi:hypothetical protein
LESLIINLKIQNKIFSIINQTSLLSEMIVAAELFVRRASDINVTYSASGDKTLTGKV